MSPCGSLLTIRAAYFSFAIFPSGASDAITNVVDTHTQVKDIVEAADGNGVPPSLAPLVAAARSQLPQNEPSVETRQLEVETRSEVRDVMLPNKLNGLTLPRSVVTKGGSEFEAETTALL
jgi:hypothetical protein